MRARFADLTLDAARFISLDRVEKTAKGWLARIDPGHNDLGQHMLLVADALDMATELALFTPSANGLTAFDRLARQHGSLDDDTAAALDAVRAAPFRLLRIEAVADGVAHVRDLASDAVLQLLAEALQPGAAGVAFAGRLVPLGDGRHMFVGCVTPLDDAGLAVAMAFLRPGASRLVNPLRCAEAVFRHVLRHGTIDVPGLNRSPDGEDDGFGEAAGSDLDLLALDWAEPGAARDPEDVQFVRTQSDLATILAMVGSVANTRAHGLGALSDAYAAIALIQLETVHRRAVAGSGRITLDAVAAAVDAAIAAGELTPDARTAFDEVRRRLGAAAPGSSARDAEVDRLISRIQALRAKTVEQGCTEQEALAAAEKVAELLDRYGLSLSELDLQRQACEGMAVETERKRAAPIDDCVPAIAAFFDCRVWGEKAAAGPQGAGTLRYVFFGLPGDVVAARYLYDLVGQAFETEMARFRSGPIYAAAPTASRRTTTNSFQIGLARGIAAKLQTLRDARETALRGASGRDLVVAKASVVDAEMDRLGLQLCARKAKPGKRVLRDAFQEGHEAGLNFDYTPGITHTGK